MVNALRQAIKSFKLFTLLKREAGAADIDIASNSIELAVYADKVVSTQNLGLEVFTDSS